MVGPVTILAGIKQFGLASDGSDLRDLEAIFADLERQNAELQAERDEARRHCSVKDKVAKAYYDNWRDAEAEIARLKALPLKDEVERKAVWLIERKGWGDNEPHWYAENGTGWHRWTKVAADAKRFAAKSEAEAYPAYQMIADDPSITLTEHVFLSRLRAGEREGHWLTPDGPSISLAECPIGLFEAGSGELCLKTEYGNNEGRIDAYIVSSGEFFWGGAVRPADQRKVIVQPVSASPSVSEGGSRG